MGGRELVEPAVLETADPVPRKPDPQAAVPRGVQVPHGQKGELPLRCQLIDEAPVLDPQDLSICRAGPNAAIGTLGKRPNRAKPLRPRDRHPFAGAQPAEAAGGIGGDPQVAIAGVEQRADGPAGQTAIATQPLPVRSVEMPDPAIFRPRPQLATGSRCQAGHVGIEALRTRPAPIPPSPPASHSRPAVSSHRDTVAANGN